MWIPSWLYRLLPLVLAAVGICFFPIFDGTGSGALNALILIVSAVITVSWRLRRLAHARAQQRAAAARDAWQRRRGGRIPI